MDLDPVEQALAELEEFDCITLYESLITIVKTNDLQWLEDYEYDIPSDRIEVLHILIKAEKLSLQQLIRIEAVDRFILSRPIPPQLEKLRSWLKRNALVVVDPNAIPNYPEPLPRPVLISHAPSRGWYTKKEIEFFQRRNEVYLVLWENATLQELQVYDGHDYRSLAPARSALQRVFWGNHLSEGQIIRLIHADLKYYLDPEAAKLAPQYLKLISELLEQYELEYLFSTGEDYPEILGEPSERSIKDYLNRWDWFTGTWGDEETRWYECRHAATARWKLHCLYQKNLLTAQIVSVLVELDKAALLSPHWPLLNSFERKFVSEFLFHQGVFDPLPTQPNSAPNELNDYLKL